MDYSITTTSPPMAEPITLTEAKLHLRVDDTADNTLITSLIKAAREYCEGFQNRTYMATTFQLKCNNWYDEVQLPLAPLWSVDSITYVDTGGTTQTLSTDIYDVDTAKEPGTVYLAYQQTWPSILGHHQSITINYNAGYACTFTAATTDYVTPLGRTFTDATRVRLYNSDGALPAGLSADTDYYVRDISGATFKLYTAATGGSLLDITGTGTGTHYIGCVPASVIAAMKLLIAHLYENREATTELALKEVPLAVKNLLWMNRLTGF